MNKQRILWADDEIDLLKPHLMFLRNKGYDVVTANNGRDALDMADTETFDLIILDENMPGLTGLETLALIKQRRPETPVIMITKSEEENIMDQAVGSKIADYLIKPVNPNQILIAIKKHLHSERLVSEKATRDYREEFGQLGMLINSANSFEDWADLYGRLVYREMELATADTNMLEMLEDQKREADKEFYKWVKRNYEDWVTDDDGPLMSPRVIPRKVFPLLDAGEKVFFILIDNFRLDHVVQGKRGFIAGGVVRSGSLVEAKILGSQMGADTLVEVGTDPSLKERYEFLKKRLEETKKSIASTEPVILAVGKRIGRGEKLPPDQLKKMKLLSQNLLKQKDQIRNDTIELTELDILFEKETEATVKVTGVAYPGTRIVIADVSLGLKKEYQYCRFKKQGADITMVAID